MSHDIPFPILPIFPIERATRVFLEGFRFTRSFTHPYERMTLGEGVWMLHDGPRTRGARRNAEVTVWRRAPEEVAALLRERVTDRYFLCVMTEGADEAEPLAAAYKRLGFRLLSREPLFVADTDGAADTADGAGAALSGGVAIAPVTDAATAAVVAKAARGKQLLPEHLKDADPPLRLLAAMADGEPIGWVRGVRVRGEAGPNGPDCGWVAGLFVRPEHRGRGVGRSLMRAMLADDARRGIRHSVLLASHAGARLYPHVGYRPIGLLMVLAPPR